MPHMEIGVPVDYRSYLRGAIAMLHESAKQHRMRGDKNGCAAMCEAHKLRLELVLRAIEKGEVL